MTDVLIEFPELEDPRSGQPLMKRTVLIANTSNMPVAAREASIYTVITIAEYYRDMGYSVALMADSTSVGPRLYGKSRPARGNAGEEGYPAYLGTRLASFYERAGRAICLGKAKAEGAVSVIGAVSPPGGDLSEPVTQNTLRVTKVFWGLDASLAYQRHFPAINWLSSYSLYAEKLGEHWDGIYEGEWAKSRIEAMSLLEDEDRLKEIVRLVGIDSLSKDERMILETSKSLREDFLHQNAFHEVDTYASMDKQFKMLRNILTFHHLAMEALKRGAALKDVTEMEIREKVVRMRYVDEKELSTLDALEEEIKKEIGNLMPAGVRSMLPREYRTITNLSGPLMVVEKVNEVRYDELVEIELASGERRRGRVLEITTDKALVQVFEGTTGIDVESAKVRFLGKVLTLPVSRTMLGRIFNGRGEPLDGGTGVIPDALLDINSNPINPYSRDFPSEFIQTGISTIDGMNPLVRGQKLPIFSGSGLPHNRMAAQIARKASVISGH